MLLRLLHHSSRIYCSPIEVRLELEVIIKFLLIWRLTLLCDISCEEIQRSEVIFSHQLEVWPDFKFKVWYFGKRRIRLPAVTLLEITQTIAIQCIKQDPLKHFRFTEISLAEFRAAGHVN